MGYINTTFAHGNGPYSRCVEWAISVNDLREEKGLKRLPIVVPLIYPDRQKRIMMGEIGINVSSDFLKKHPFEILLDEKQGVLLNQLMFKENNYADNLSCLLTKYYGVEGKIQTHLNGKRKLKPLVNTETVEIDLRDCEFQLGLNNRVQTGLPNQFYATGGAGPLHEILSRAVGEKQISLDKKIMKDAVPIAERMIENQKIVFLNEPGVFSYDGSYQKRDNEIFTPGFIHPPKPDTTELPEKGIYLIMTGIDSIRKSGLYDAVANFGIQIYAPESSQGDLPEVLRKKTIALNPSQINNRNIIAQYGRAGWSSIWLSHMAEKGFITPPYQPGDDPEIFFNHQRIVDLKLGVIMDVNDLSESLKKAVELSKNVGNYNNELINRYGTLDGINYASKKVVEYLNKT